MRASSARTDRSRQADLFGNAPRLPEGLLYREDAIGADEELHYAQQFKLLPFAPFEFHGFLGRRRVVSFGRRYDYAARQLREANALPEWLLPLRQRAADIAGLPVESLKQALVTEYDAAAAIGWHRDKPMFGGSPSPSCHPVACACAAVDQTAGSAARSTCARVRPTCCAAKFASNGSTASRQSRACAIR